MSVLLPPTDHRRGSPAHVFGPSCVLNALHLLLIAVSVASCVLFGLLQSGLQGFDPLSGGPQSLLHLRELATEVGVVPEQLHEGTHAAVTNILLNEFKEVHIGTCLCALESCSRLFSRKEIFCFWAVLPSEFSESNLEFCTPHTASFFSIPL